MWKPATLGNPPGFAGGKITPTMARGALVRCFHYHRTNDTGHKKAPLLKGAGTAKP